MSSEELSRREQRALATCRHRTPPHWTAPVGEAWSLRKPGGGLPFGSKPGLDIPSFFLHCRLGGCPLGPRKAKRPVLRAGWEPEAGPSASLVGQAWEGAPGGGGSPSPPPAGTQLSTIPGRVTPGGWLEPGRGHEAAWDQGGLEGQSYVISFPLGYLMGAGDVLVRF